MFKQSLSNRCGLKSILRLVLYSWCEQTASVPFVSCYGWFFWYKNTNTHKAVCRIRHWTLQPGDCSSQWETDMIEDWPMRGQHLSPDNRVWSSVGDQNKSLKSADTRLVLQRIPQTRQAKSQTRKTKSRLNNKKGNIHKVQKYIFQNKVQFLYSSQSLKCIKTFRGALFCKRRSLSSLCSTNSHH